MKRILTGLAIAGLLVACSSTPTDEQEGAKVEERLPASKPAQTKPEAPSTATKPLDTGRVAGDPLKDPANILSKRSIYFDYDSNLIKDEFKPVVSAHAKYLSQNRSRRVRVEGNTDERGSREYNLALGQRRADAVKQMLQLLGASSEQIETLSFGEEKPKSQGHDEAAWAENRRADIRYQGE
ncbi:MAG TPA: peptidoglycan-associated lipoprotein Pal [Burkholderiales bacterium]|nr:peptidoglycan-associated lipoprotein Pal [Burkholderiales bacterium]